MGQTRLWSLIESITNIVVGLTLSWLVNFYLLRYLGYEVSHQAIGILAVVLTAISLIRSYILRRIFNSIHYRI